MNTYKRSRFYRKLTMVCALLILLSGSFNVLTRNWGLALFQFFMGFTFITQYILEGRPYITMGEGKLIIHYGLRAKENNLGELRILSEDIRVIKLENMNKENQKTLKIRLDALEEDDRKRFITDIHLFLDVPKKPVKV